MHHFREIHLEAKCPNCRRDHGANWQPEWWKHDHYLTAICDCGYRIFLKTENNNSGHYAEDIASKLLQVQNDTIAAKLIEQKIGK